MKKNILVFLFSIIMLLSKAQYFQHAYGGDTSHTVGLRVYDAQDSGYYLFASRDLLVNGTLQITRTNRFGDSLWSKFIAISSDINFDFCRTFDSGFAIVSYAPDTVFLTKLDSLCNIESVVFYIDTNDYRPTNIIQTSDSAYLIAGYIYKSYYPWPSYIYATKIASGGNILWTKQMLYYTDSGEYPAGLMETTDHFYVIAAYQESGDNSPGYKLIIKLDTAGDSIWTIYSYGFFQSINYITKNASLLSESTNGYLLLGNTAGHSWDVGNCIVEKFDTGGNFQGGKQFSGPFYFNMAHAHSGGFYLTGIIPDSLFPDMNNLIITHVNDNIDSLNSYTFRVAGYSTTGTYITQFPNTNIAAIGLLDSLHTNYLPTSIFFVVCDTSGNISASISDIPSEEQQLEIYPNPTREKITIGNIDLSLETIELFNLLGEKIPVVADYKLRTVDCALLPSGIYIIQISGAGKIWHSKIIRD